MTIKIMSIEQARQFVARAERELEDVERKLQNHQELVKSTSAEVAISKTKLGTANSILLDIIDNEPTEDKVIDMNHCSPIFNYNYASMTGWSKPPIPEGYMIEYVFLGHNTIFVPVDDDYDKLDWSKVAIFRIVAIKDGFKHE